MEPKKKLSWDVSYSWTQPYLPTSYNPFYQSVQDAELERELDRLDAVDVLVDEMLTYPDAEAILNKIRQQGTGNV
jgi:hypothetical protein